MEQSYLIRFGLMGDVGRFTAEFDTPLERGESVVLRSHRGIELGEVLHATVPRAPSGDPPGQSSQVLRLATKDDIERARLAESERADRFHACQHVFESGTWPLDLIDVELLLDGDRLVAYCLGPHGADAAELLAALHAASGLPVIFQTIGSDLEEAEPTEDHDHACGSCSTGGGCGSSHGCGETERGCSGCAVKELLVRGSAR
jgi:hypothetical protein